MKSIISRYGELKTSPTSLVDSEGEELSFNKVDAALKSVGISMKDANGQFRDFDEVIMELSSKWQSLDKNTQRYIATVMAGNRQQSRFLALVSNYSRLAELTEEAANSQDAGTLQYLKTLDSIESKMNQLKVAFQEFYTSMGLENLFKGALDSLTGFITTLNSLPKLFDTIPVAAIGMATNLILTIKNILSLLTTPIYTELQKIKSKITEVTGSKYELNFHINKEKVVDEAVDAARAAKEAAQKELDSNTNVVTTEYQYESRKPRHQQEINKINNTTAQIKQAMVVAGNLIKLAGATLSATTLARQSSAESMLASGRESNKLLSGMYGAGGNILGGLLTGFATGHPLLGVITAVVQSIPNIITLFDGLTATSKEVVAQLDKEIQKQKEQVVLRRGEVSELETAAKKLEELREHQYDSTEAYQDYIDYMNQLGDSHSELISRLDAEGNSVIELKDVYQQLIHTRAQLTEEELKQRKLELERETVNSNEVQRILGLSGRDVTKLVPSGGSLGYVKGAVEKQNYSVEDLINLTISDLAEKSIPGIALEAVVKNLANSSVWNVVNPNTDASKVLQQINSYKAGKYNEDYLQQLQGYLLNLQSYGEILTDKTKELAEVNEQLGEINTAVNKWIDTQSEGKPETIQKQLSQFQTSPVINLIAQQLENLKDLDLDTDEGIEKANDILLPLFDEYKSKGAQWEQEYVDYYVGMFSHTDEEIQAFLAGLESSEEPFAKERFTEYQQKYDENIEDFETQYIERINNFFDKYYQDLGLNESDVKKIPIKNFARGQWDSLITQLYDGVGNYIEQGLYSEAHYYYDNYLDLLSSINAKTTDSKISNALLDLVTSTNFTDYESIAQLVSSLEAYDATNDEIDLSDIIPQLNAIKQNLSYNINTITNEYITALTTFVEAADTLAKDTTKGLDYKDLVGALARIKTLEAGKDLDFTDIVQFSDEAGAYVYTTRGFLLAQEQVTEQIRKQAEDERTRIEAWQEQLNNVQLTDLWSFWDSNDNASKEELTKATSSISDESTRTLVQRAIKNGVTSLQEFQTWFNQEIEDNAAALEFLPEQERLALEQFFYNTRNTLMSAMDWGKLVQGTDIEFSTQQLSYIFGNIFGETKTAEQIEQMAQQYAQTLTRTGITAVEAYQQMVKETNVKFDYSTAKTLYEGRFANAASTISDIFNTNIGDVISEEANALLVAAHVEGFSADKVGVFDSFEQMVDAVKAVYAAMDETNSSLAQRNYAFAAVLEGEQLKTDQAKGIIENSANLSYDNLADYANLINQNLEQIIADGVLIIKDAFGKFRITDEGIQTLLADADVSGWELAEVIKSRNEALIKADKEIAGTITDEVNALTGAKIGDKLDLTYVQNAFGDFGGQLVNGILEVTENTNILQLASDIRARMEASGQFLQSDIDALGDAIDSLLKSYASLISGGIKGSLSQTDASSLQNFASSVGMELDFTRTKNGLKISTDQAGKLYQELKKIDSITAELVFDDLVDSLSEAGSGFENISQTMARIAEKQREIANAQGDTSGLEQQLALYKEIALAQSDNPDSFAFMDNKIPTGMQGPENYWNAVGNAFKVMNQAGQSGYMEIQDFYNITQEMKNLAIMSGNDLTFMGQTIYADGSGAAELIEMAMNALSNVDADGVKVDFSKLGQSFSGGAADMASGFDDAIKTMAKAQIEMLDAEIAMLEAIVAMEKLGDIDVDKNGILDPSELFKDDGSYTEGWDKLRQQLVDTFEGSETLKPYLEKLKIGGIELGKLLDENQEAWRKAGISQEQYSQIMTAIYQAAINGNYDLDSVISSVTKELSKTDQIFEIEVGDKTFVFGYNTHIESNDKGEYVVGDKTFTDPEIALKTAALEKLNVDNYTWNEETKEVTGTLTIDHSKVKVTPLADGSVQYEIGDTVTTSQFEMYHQAYLDYKEHAEGAGISVEDEVEWQTRVLGHVVVGEVTIDNPDAFKARMHDDVVALAEKLNSGTDEEIVEAAAKIGIQVDYSDTLGLTEEQRQQIAELANIESKVVTEDIAVNITGDDADNIKKLLGEELPEASINVNLQKGESSDSILTELLEAQDTPISREMEVDVSATGEFTANFVDSLNNLNADNLELVVTKLAALSSSLRNVQDVDFSNINQMHSQWDGVLEVVQEVADLVASLTEKTFTVTVEYQAPTAPTPTSGTVSTPTVSTVTNYNTVNSVETPKVDVSGFVEAAQQVEQASAAAGTSLETVSTSLNGVPSDASKAISDTADSMKRIPKNVGTVFNTVGSALSTAAQRASGINSLAAAINKLPSNRTVKITIIADTSQAKGTVKVEGADITNGNIRKTADTDNNAQLMYAKGNVALAGGTQKTLVGELGPELVVSRGHYYIVGQNGAEFVDLDKDAIVFNHLQTRKLLGSGHAGRGSAITNERTAVSWATGNVQGPAMASASEALALLKQIRAMWQSMLNASLKDLGGLAGRGGGSGGGGGNTKLSPQIGEFERWYNLLRQIADLEQKITLEEAKRKNMRNGADYSRSLQKEMQMLSTQLADQKELNLLQESWLKKEIADFQKTQFTKIYNFTEDGLMQLVDGAGRGLDILTKLTMTDENGRLIRNLNDSAVNQAKYLESVGFSLSDFLIDQETGNNLNLSVEEDAAKVLETFWDRVQYYLDNIDGLRDTIADGRVEVEELLTKIAELEQEYIDNQLKEEQALLKAIEDREQAVIDALNDEKEAIQKASKEYIQGLSDALQRERDMYQRNDTQKETTQLQRQLAILQRSGGSAAEIKNLQDQINSRLKDSYFQEQQDQIDAIQQASDKEIERLDKQIELMTDSLEYQKEHGLLWAEVAEMMQNWSPESIVDFLQRNTKDYQSKSALDQEQQSQDWLKQAQMDRHRTDADAAWEAYKANMDSSITEANGYDINAIEHAFKSKHGEGIGSANQAAAEEIAAQRTALQRKSRSEAMQASGAYEVTNTNATTNTSTAETGNVVAFGGGNTIGLATTTGNTIPLLKKAGGSMKDESLWLTSGVTSLRATGFVNDDSSADGTRWIEAVVKNGNQTLRGWFNAKAVKSLLTTDSLNALRAQLKAFGAKKIGFSEGGLDDFTGLAMLHGTKQKPEAVLNAEQTKFLREEFLGSSKDSFMNTLLQLKDLYSNFKKVTNIDNNSGAQYVFENVALNLNTGTIASDYDARRAGDQIWNELMSIARKSGNVSLSRR